MDLKKFERIKIILLDLENKGIIWDKVEKSQKRIFLKGIATIEEADEVYAEMQREIANGTRDYDKGMEI